LSIRQKDAGRSVVNGELIIVNFFNSSLFWCIEISKFMKKYHNNTSQGATELTEIHRDS